MKRYNRILCMMKDEVYDRKGYVPDIGNRGLQ